MKVANIVRTKEGIVTIREPYHFAAKGAKFEPEYLFLPHEESNYLNDKLPDTDWLDIVTDDRNFLEHVNIQGYRYLGKKWRCIFAVWRDTGKAICVPADSQITDLRDIGIVVNVGPLTNTGKVSKYINRLFAPLPKGNKLIHGTLTSESSFVDREDLVPLVLERYTLSNGADIQVLYDDMSWMDDATKAAVDGCITIGPDAAVALELSREPKLGEAWRGTFGTRQGVGKGHIMLVPSMGNYVRIYGPKYLVKTEDFTFGSMGPLHVGIPHTDPQAYWNFDFDRPELGEALARKFMRAVKDAADDEEALRETFLRYTFNPDESEAPDLESWLLRKALAYNIPIVSREDEQGNRIPGHPGLLRRVVSYLMKKVMDCENGRIPMDGVAVYGYVLPDPFVFNAWGMPNLALSRIDDGEIVMPDIEKGIEVVVYRQPSENDNAHFFLTTVMSDAYKAFAGRGICLLGKGAKPVLNRLGGGDMDDMFVIVNDPVWVNGFKTLERYPETEKLVAVSTKQNPIYEGDEFFEELASGITDRPKPGEYGRRQFSYQIDQAAKAGVGIGPVVNMGGIDKLLSQPRHREYILQQLEAMDAAKKDSVTEIYAWFVDRKPYQAAKYMTNLELVIDGNVKDETLLDVLGNVTEDVKKFHEDLRIYPTSMERRIPAKKVAKADYILLDTLMCRSFKRIASMRDKLTEFFHEKEWLSVGPADNFVLEFFPQDPDIKGIVNELRETWRTEWQKVFQAGVSDDDRANSFKRIEREKIEPKLAGFEKENMQEIAVELYRQTYRKEYVMALTNADGRRRTFPDSLLWTHKLGSALIDAFHTAGVAGATTGVELMPEFQRLQRGKVKVKVTGGLVERISNGELIGYCIKPNGKKTCPDGEFVMSGGTITWKECELGKY